MFRVETHLWICLSFTHSLTHCGLQRFFFVFFGLRSTIYLVCIKVFLNTTYFGIFFYLQSQSTVLTLKCCLLILKLCYIADFPFFSVFPSFCLHIKKVDLYVSYLSIPSLLWICSFYKVLFTYHCPLLTGTNGNLTTVGAGNPNMASGTCLSRGIYYYYGGGWVMEEKTRIKVKGKKWKRFQGKRININKKNG